MNQNNTPNTPNEEYNPNLEAQDEDVLSGGNNRLTYILLGVIIALVVGYIALPKGSGSGMASVTPSFMLSDAAVTAPVPAAEDPAAAKADADEDAPAATTKTTAKPAAAAATTTAAAAAAAPATAAPVAEVDAAAPAPAPAPAAAPEPAAPTTTTLAGKIEDENGRPLAGATVFLKGSNKIASTDASGNYSIEVPASGDNVLTYGYGGYDDETITARGSKAVNVTLTPHAKTGRKRR
ncbi:carboxypeptidase-like regulatory domain-containing protein [Hymenobacter sp. DH14]|uniref:Carboxypeptidase-like regulatory domain-containing protein n=1 Tax=Hymenobacter cyanobacteriorum TaxID=2926463 RepID=A0A9X2AEM5_9BACT|nr:carboxypeptidase-like regulatory domain-containing protein [Hymenobacter cyanobacteriorum]MCI1187386.1 carboxypeptidase-like regulatory domain-containing protein [Hymenobacter cyanobacteriorum]